MESEANYKPGKINPECIEQQGHVIRQIGDLVEVLIIANSACLHCSAKGSCQALDSKEKQLNIRSKLQFAPGDKVIIRMDSHLGQRAVLLGFIFPLLALVSGTIICFLLTAHQGWSALAGLVSASIYFLILTRYRKKLERTFSLSLSPAPDA
jgi:sigma-E factor negative regulatory protein RseC